jgi:hypothetical protein
MLVIDGKIRVCSDGKTGQRKLRRDSAEVHEECKSVLVYLMENRQARKINNRDNCMERSEA